MTPTTRTGWRIAAATLKYTAEPPSASAVSPNGVNTESSATLPTTSRLMRSHPVRSRKAEEAKSVAEDDARRPGEDEPGPLGRFRFAAHRAGGAFRGRAAPRAGGHGVREPEERRQQLVVLRRRERVELGRLADRLRLL